MRRSARRIEIHSDFDILVRLLGKSTCGNSGYLPSVSLRSADRRHHLRRSALLPKQ